ncbi:MAG: hypothetical protein HY591_03775 [Candidatus Omnitrophica bacterium]|nr:hypothetical protein [Candidatus Omnitrophota bacterium]
MKNMLYVFLFILAFFCSIFAFAAQRVDLEKEHGKKLDKAPFYMRYKFQKTTGTDWPHSTYERRKAFLEDWYAQAARERELDDQQRKIEQEEQKAAQKMKEGKKRQQRQKLKKKLKFEREEEKEKENLKKTAEKRLRQQERELRDLRRQDRKSLR